MSDPYINIEGPVCPVPLTHNEQIVLGHGSGGKMSHDLIRKTFLSAFDNSILRTGDDAAPLEINGAELSVSVDAHVVTPLFFPGGDIGKLAVCGTVNDVAMLGARPLYLTAAFILEEGLPIETLQRVVDSMKRGRRGSGRADRRGRHQSGRARQSGRVVHHHHGRRAAPAHGNHVGGAKAKAGDAVILSGPIGDHGIAVLGARGELGFQSDIQSDVAPLNHLIEAMLDASPNVHVLRDPTRGGLATTLNEIAAQSKCCITLNEQCHSRTSRC